MSENIKEFDDLMIDYLSETITEDGRKRLYDLLNTDFDLKIRFDEMLKLRAVLFIPEIEKGKKVNYSQLIKQMAREPQITPRRSWIRNLQRIAAIIIFAALSYYVLRDITSANDASIVCETLAPAGSQTKIILPDSTVVWINSGSSLKYNQSFGKKDRKVTLLGEGYFEVKKDKGKPFSVRTDSLLVTVTGTIFNVRSYAKDSNVEINLIEGAVNVSLPETKNAVLLTMKANEKIVFNKQTKKIETFQTDAYRSALWTTGKLCFVDATFEQISKDLERKYNVKILIVNEKLKQEFFSGSLDLNLSLKEILFHIDVDKKFKIDQNGDTIRIGIKNL
jgi:ferric-dicitrate binding protein FerR (iron transport regulator)